jgi:hypothetical protein
MPKPSQGRRLGPQIPIQRSLAIDEGMQRGAVALLRQHAGDTLAQGVERCLVHFGGDSHFKRPFSPDGTLSNVDRIMIARYFIPLKSDSYVRHFRS